MVLKRNNEEKDITVDLKALYIKKKLATTIQIYDNL